MKLKTSAKTSTTHHKPELGCIHDGDAARIKVVIGSCAHCAKLADTVSKAMEELGISLTDMRRITEIKDMVRLGIVATPALIIDGKIVSTGKLLSLDDTKEILSNYYQGK